MGVACFASLESERPAGQKIVVLRPYTGIGAEERFFCATGFWTFKRVFLGDQILVMVKNRIWASTMY